MITRILPESEWPRLIGTEAETVWPHLQSGACQVLVVEDDQRIVGTWILIPVLHAECLWIAPEKRKTASVARRLWSALKSEAQRRGARTVVTAAQTDEVRDLLSHVHAIKMPGDHYVMRMPCPQQ